MSVPTAPSTIGQVHPPGSPDPRFIAIGNPPRWSLAGAAPKRPVPEEGEIDLGPLTAALQVERERIDSLSFSSVESVGMGDEIAEYTDIVVATRASIADGSVVELTALVISENARGDVATARVSAPATNQPFVLVERGGSTVIEYDLSEEGDIILANRSLAGLWVNHWIRTIAP